MLLVVQMTFGLLDVLKNFQKSKSLGDVNALNGDCTRQLPSESSLFASSRARLLDRFYWGPPLRTAVQNSLARGGGQK